MPPLFITGAHVWDGLGPRRSPTPRAIRIEDGCITAIGGAAVPTNDPATRIDLAAAGRAGAGPWTAIPGLIDAHVHLTLDPDVRDPDAQEAAGPERIEAAMAARAEQMVRAGITTARDLGGGAWREIALRDRIEAGELAGPRIRCAGQPVTSPGGHCHFWGGEAGDAKEIRAVVERQVARGADWIKVMATGGVMTRGTRPSDAQFDREALSGLVAAARAHGRPVAAHCHATAGIRNAAGAGVRTVEHCSFAGAEGFGSDLDDAVVAALASRDDVWVSPTVNAGWARLRERDGGPTGFAERMGAAFGRLRAAGVRLIASTDAGIPGVAHHHLPEALAVFAQYAGLAPVEALRSATSESARALGLGGETGALRPGLAADVVVVEGDPLRDLAALRRPRLVVARGRVVEARRPERAEDTSSSRRGRDA